MPIFARTALPVLSSNWTYRLLYIPCPCKTKASPSVGMGAIELVVLVNVDGPEPEPELMLGDERGTHVTSLHPGSPFQVAQSPRMDVTVL